LEIPPSANGGLALNKADVWAGGWFWAPEVYQVKDKLYMYYSEDEHICVAPQAIPRHDHSGRKFSNP